MEQLADQDTYRCPRCGSTNFELILVEHGSAKRATHSIVAFSGQDANHPVVGSVEIDFNSENSDDAYLDCERCSNNIQLLEAGRPTQVYNQYAKLFEIAIDQLR